MQYSKTSLEFFERINVLLEQIRDESDRGAVLLGVSFLDDLLGRVLSSFMRDVPSAKKLLEGFNAPLGTFAARIAVAEALGLLMEEEVEWFKAVKKIRNTFAHSWDPSSFSEGKVRDMGAALPWLGPDGTEDTEGKSPRARFEMVVGVLSHGMLHRRKWAADRRRVLLTYPDILPRECQVSCVT